MVSQDAAQVSAINPFTPGFGQVPQFLAGRSFMLADIERALESPGFSPDLTTLFVGARGTGKTALLSYIAAFAESVGWISVSVSAVPGMLEDIYDEALRKSKHLFSNQGERRLKGVTIGGVSIEWDNPPQRNDNWRTRMNDLFDELERVGAGLLITVDEVKPSVDEMIRLATLYQHFVRENRRVSLMMAGLPAFVSALLSHDSVSFLRRAQYRKLDPIADYEVAEALRRTVEASGRVIGDDALNEAVHAVDGFPYMLQLVGFQSWRRNPSAGEVLESDVAAGIQVAAADMRDKVLRTTYGELSAGDVRFVNAMLDEGGEPTLAQVSARMGVKSNYSTKYKTRLIEAGVIDVTERKRLKFALPYFEDYAREMRENDEF